MSKCFFVLDEVTQIFRSLLKCCLQPIHYSCFCDLMCLNHSLRLPWQLGRSRDRVSNCISPQSVRQLKKDLLYFQRWTQWDTESVIQWGGILSDVCWSSGSLCTEFDRRKWVLPECCFYKIYDDLVGSMRYGITGPCAAALVSSSVTFSVMSQLVLLPLLTILFLVNPSPAAS